MIFSRTPAFVFFAVPKTGSTSVETALESYADTAVSSRWNKHVLAMKLVEEMPAELWSASFRFAFVRDPFDWMYSWYRYRQRDALRDPTHKHHHRYTGGMSYDTFVATFRSGDLMLTQSDFLVDEAGDLLVDFVGRYENLQRDFEHVCDRLGIPAQPLPRTNESRARSSERPVMAESSRQIIREYFARDFAQFGY